MPLLLILSILSPLVAIIAGFGTRKQTLLWYYPLTGFVFDVTISFLKRGLHMSHKWPANIFILAEFILISCIYRKHLFRSRKAFILFVTGFSLAFTAHTLSYSLLEFNKTGSSIFTFIYIIYGIYGLYTILKKQDVIYLEKSWFFWLNVALIIYASGNFLLFLFRDYMVRENRELYLLLWKNVFLTLNIIKNLLLAVSLYRLSKEARHEPG